MAYTTEEEKILFGSYLHHKKTVLSRIMTNFSASGLETCLGLVMLFVDGLSSDMMHGKTISEHDYFGIWSYYRQLHNNESRVCDKLKEIEFDPIN